MNKNQKGFTLVELLVVIAIIGILSSVAVINLNSARDKAKTAAAQATISQLMTPIILCLDGQSSLDTAEQVNTGVAGGNLCATPSVVNIAWPKINNHGYNWDNSFGTSDNDAGTWSFKVLGDGTLKNINCSQAGCVY